MKKPFKLIRNENEINILKANFHIRFCWILTSIEVRQGADIKRVGVDFAQISKQSPDVTKSSIESFGELNN